MESASIRHRMAVLDDAPALAAMNRQLTEDEGHANRFKPIEWFETRMRRFLAGEYQAVLFLLDGKPVAYALYTDRCERDDTIYLRQLFVARDHRRQGVGREVVRILNEHVWPRDKRITVGVLTSNAPAASFYQAVGFIPYALELELRRT